MKLGSLKLVIGGGKRWDLGGFISFFFLGGFVCLWEWERVLPPCLSSYTAFCVSFQFQRFRKSKWFPLSSSMCRAEHTRTRQRMNEWTKNFHMLKSRMWYLSILINEKKMSKKEKKKEQYYMRGKKWIWIIWMKKHYIYFGKKYIKKVFES